MIGRPRRAAAPCRAAGAGSRRRRAPAPTGGPTACGRAGAARPRPASPGSGCGPPATRSASSMRDVLGEQLLVLGELLLELEDAVALGLDPAADEQDRRQQHEHGAERAEPEVHADAEDDGDRRRDRRQALLAGALRRGRQLDLGAAVRAGHARRPVELDAVARGNGLDGAQVVADLEAEVTDRRRPGRAAAPSGVVIATPSTTTPFFEPRSVIVTTSVTLMRQCRRVACWSLMTMSQSRSRPSRLSP